MYRLAALLSLVTLAMTGCGAGGAGDPGGGGGSATKDVAGTESSTPSATATTDSFFGAGDTASVNRAAGAAQRAGTRARDAANMKRCNRLGSRGYPAWRACWHGLLDPAEESLNALAVEMKDLASHDLPADCVTSLGRARDSFARFARDVAALSEGTDSDSRAAQVRTARRYPATLDRITRGYTKPFQALTQVCYSPKDLASINASPHPSGTPAP